MSEEAAPHQPTSTRSTESPLLSNPSTAATPPPPVSPVHEQERLAGGVQHGLPTPPKHLETPHWYDDLLLRLHKLNSLWAAYKSRMLAISTRLHMDTRADCNGNQPKTHTTAPTPTPEPDMD